MIAEKILGNIHNAEVNVPIDFVLLDWFEADSKRLRKITEGGREIGIAVNEKLDDGDILYTDSKFCIAVRLAECELTKITVSSMEEMGRLCFEIGNRHLSLKITGNEVLIPYDAPTEQHLINLGFCCEKIIGKFDRFIVCKAHGHSHGHHHSHE
ncbi:MAG: urease accessory protein UreE [Ruminococcus sp.]|nr:urease accessory protein UreE [Ruminococcus sp.]